MTLQSPIGSPIAYAEVRLTDAGGNQWTDSLGQASGPIQSSGWTDSLGQVSGLVPANKALLMEVIAYPCYNVIYSQAIGPFDRDIDLGNIVVQTSSIVSISGKLLNCNGMPVTNGYVMINYSNMVRYAATDKAGNFATYLIFCPGSSSSFQVLGVDNTVKQQGNSVSVNVAEPETNTGNILACGTSSEQYINYTLDGVDHSITSALTDSLLGTTELVQASPPNYYTTIWGMDNPDYIDFGYLHNNSVGTFPMNNLSLALYDSSTNLISPFNMIISNYPQNVGEFYEGHFSGQFTHFGTGTVLHNINCSFRVRRQS
jgi:hypothetical protein